MFGNTFLFAKSCFPQLHAVSFWFAQSSWLGVKYQLINWLFMLSERKLNQTCAGFIDHCVNSTTCDPDTKICVTEDSKCCLNAIPEVLSTPFLRLCLTVSLTFYIVLFVSFCMSLSVLTLCSAVATPPLSNYPSLSRTRSGVPRMQKSESIVLRTQRYRRYILLRT